MANQRNKNKNDSVRINEKDNINNFFTRKIYKVLSFFKFGLVYFFDTTNFVLSENEIRVARKINFYTNLPLFKHLITEKVDNEIKEKIAQKRNVVIDRNKYSVISFESMRLLFPGTCPIYYNYISCMHNPAVMDSPYFAIECLLRELAKSGELSENKKLVYKNITNQFEAGRNNKTNFFGEPKGDYEKLIDESLVKRIQKKKESIKKPYHNLFNDCKNLSLSIIYCLYHSKNVVYITSDIDNIANILFWVDGISQQFTIKTLVLNRFGRLPGFEKDNWKKGKPLTMYFDYEDEFQKFNNGVRDDILSHDWKKISFSFVLRYYDKKTKRFTDFKFSFTKKIREILINLHDNNFCPHVRNVDYGNWFGYKFWPILPNNKYFKITLFNKPLIKNNLNSDFIIHGVDCQNTHLDAMVVDDFKAYSQFQ